MWQPIETAHQTPFLVMLCEEGRFVHMGWYDKENNQWITVLKKEGSDGVCYPTHWMPLPKPPKGEGL